MVLLTLAGVAARTLLSWEPGVAVGLLAGFVIASMIPAKTSCRVAPAAEPSDLTKRP